MSTKKDASREALNNQKEFYNERFRKGYMKDFSGLYESCRLYTIRKLIDDIKNEGFSPNTVLDYGCGEGRYIGILKECFPKSDIYGSDISEVGLQIAKDNYQYVKCITMSDEIVDIKDNYFDLIICIEVLEHVKDVKKSINEIERLLKKNGIVIITTPCGNKYSLEWFINKITFGIQSSFDGYIRFSTDEPAHLRRLTDDDIKVLLSNSGIDVFKIYHRAHLFTTLVEPIKILPNYLMTQIGLLDWHLFKNFSNGATMITIGKKL